MENFIPPFDFHRVVVEPWTQPDSGFLWIALMGFFVTTACGLVGNYLILRRMALVGDAISHSILPGIAVAFLLAKSRNSLAMFLGALAAGGLTTIIIETIHKRSRVKQDAAIGIAFTSLFALGVILISLFASKIDLDQECVLYGEIAFVPLEQVVQLGGWALGPVPVVRMAAVTLVVALLIVCFYKELLVSSFDPALAISLGINSAWVYYALMAMLSVVVVSAFEAVGAILVVAMLILPGATATLLSQRLPVMLGLTVFHAALSAVLGLHLGLWLNCSLAAAMVVAGSGLFVAAMVFFGYQQRRARMNNLQTLAVVTALSMIAFGSGCRKRASKDLSSTASSTEAADPAAPASTEPKGKNPATAPVPAMSAKDQATIQEQFMSKEVGWITKTPDQKKMASYGWCQQYMFGDAAAKARVLAEIRKAGLPPADLKALKEENRKLGFPPLPL